MITMDATADPSGQPGTLRLATAGPGPIAGGVGIQVRDALNNPVVFGQAVDVGPSQPARLRRVLHRALHPDHRHGDGGARPMAWPP